MPNTTAANLCASKIFLHFENIYKFGFTTGTTQTGYASAIAYVLFLIILAVSIIQLKVFNQDEEKAAARRAKKRALSKTK